MAENSRMQFNVKPSKETDLMKRRRETDASKFKFVTSLLK